MDVQTHHEMEGSGQPRRRVSSGSRRAALIDGYNPATTDTPRASAIQIGIFLYAITTTQCANDDTRYTTPIPSAAPRIPPRIPTNSDSSRNCSPIFERLWPTARRMPISDDRWITEIDITFAMPSPPTASASNPANNAVCCSVLSACDAAFSTSLGTLVDT